MSLSNNRDASSRHDLLSLTTTAVASSSSSSSSKHNAYGPRLRSPSPYLAPPRSKSQDRSSLDSTFSSSTVSDLDIPPNPESTSHSLPLLRTTSTTSSQLPTTLSSRLSHALSNFYLANYGALLVLLSQLFGSLMNLFTTLLEHSPSSTPSSPSGMHPFQILFVRQSITSFVCTSYALYTGSIPDFPFGPRITKIRLLLICRGVCGFFGVFGMYFSLLYLPLAEATVLTFLAPILTCYLCSMVLPGEQGGFGRQQQLAGLVSLVGVVFIARPGSLFSGHNGTADQAAGGMGNTTLVDGGVDAPVPPAHSPPTPTAKQHGFAILISLLGVVGATGAMTSIRAIGKSAHPFLSINYFSVICSVVSLGCLAVFPGVNFRLPNGLREWGLLAGLGGCGFTMQWLLTAGLAYGSKKEMPKVNEEGAGLEGLKRVESRNTRRREERMKGSGTRATSMVYTQMLFALGFDKWVFGKSPGVMSWVGSGLILTGAIWVAAAQDGSKAKRGGDAVVEMRRIDNGERVKPDRSEEVREQEVGLMTAGTDDDEDEGEGDRGPNFRAAESRSSIPQRRRSYIDQ